MTEVRIVPRVRTETQTIKTPVSKCGDNWFKAVRVRAPYKGTDMAFRTLPSLGDPGQVEGFDPMFIEEIQGDHGRIADFAHGHADTLTSKQRANVQTMLDRAARYLIDAAGIAAAWASGFATTRAGSIPAWPLNGHPKGAVNNLTEEGHRRDQDKYKKLVRSALKNLRCAEEVSKKATIRNRNKMRSRGRRFGEVQQGSFNPVEPMPGNSIPGLDIPEPVSAEFNPIEPVSTELDPQADSDAELEEGDIVLDEEPADEIEEDQAPATAAKKKKDNTLLFAGAAALGFLALKGR